MLALEIFSDLPVLYTERMLLRKLTPHDAEDIYAYASDPEVARHTAWEHHRDLEASHQFIQFVLSCYAQGRVAPWAMVDSVQHKVIGTCGFVGWWPDQGRAELGFALARSHWNRGYATEANRAVMAFAFEQAGVNRLEGRCYPENHGSARVMEKLGMQFEGVLRQHFFAKGKYHDVRMYSRLREEWEHGQ